MLLQWPGFDWDFSLDTFSASLPFWRSVQGLLGYAYVRPTSPGRSILPKFFSSSNIRVSNSQTERYSSSWPVAYSCSSKCIIYMYVPIRNWFSRTPGTFPFWMPPFLWALRAYSEHITILKYLCLILEPILNNTSQNLMGFNVMGQIHDKRVTMQYWTFWLVAIIGGLGLLLSLMQIIMQSVQLTH